MPAVLSDVFRSDWQIEKSPEKRTFRKSRRLMPAGRLCLSHVSSEKNYRIFTRARNSPRAHNQQLPENAGFLITVGIKFTVRRRTDRRRRFFGRSQRRFEESRRKFVCANRRLGQKPRNSCIRFASKEGCHDDRHAPGPCRARLDG